MICTVLFMFIFMKINITIATAGCTISLRKDLNDPQPLLIKTEHGKSFFLEPFINSDLISLDESENFEVYCPGGLVHVDDEILKYNSTQVSCFRGNFYVNNKKVTFYKIRCSKPPQHHARFSGKYCLGKRKEFTIGYEYQNTFLTLMTGCFDNKKENTFYTFSVVPKTIAGRQIGYARASYWVQGAFYNTTNVNNLYKRKTLMSTVNNLLGLNETSTKYISETGSYYINRGHLTPRGDFLFGSQQRATFYFANSAPQWEQFNKGNWKTLEQNIRDLASNRKLDLEVYTGTFEILSFPHELTGKLTKLYLYANPTTKKIPIPKYIWKIVFHKESKSGVGFIGVNNPYIKDHDLKNYTICKDICHKLDYVTLSTEYSRRGYVYCCEVNDLKSRIDTNPSLTARNLLI